MLSTGAFLSLLVTITTKSMAVTDFDYGRTFILIPHPLTWEQASEECRKLNGTLGTIERVEVIPDLGYDWGWTFWVGLRITTPGNMTWQDGRALNWTNWAGPLDSNAEPGSTCAAARTASPYAWVQRPCTNTLPSVCQVVEGNCYFTRSQGAAVQGHNDRSEILDRPGCLERCRTARDFDCRSAEMNAHFNVCQLSVDTRWTQPKYFLTNDRDWDYYHWTCFNGTYLGGERIFPNVTDEPTVETTTPTTTSTTTTTTTTPTTTTYTTITPTTTTSTTTKPTTTPKHTTTSAYVTTQDPEGEKVCVYVKPMPVNETEEVRQDVQELQTLSVAFKEQKRMKKKISTSDSRSSATYVGALAVGFVAFVLGSIVFLDIISLPRHLQQMHGATCSDCKLRRKLKLKRKEVQFTEYSEHRARVLTAGSPIVINARVPHNFRPSQLTRDMHLERMYSGCLEDVPGTYKTRNDTSWVESFDESSRETDASHGEATEARHRENPLSRWKRMRTFSLRKVQKIQAETDESIKETSNAYLAENPLTRWKRLRTIVLPKLEKMNGSDEENNHMSDIEMNSMSHSERRTASASEWTNASDTESNDESCSERKRVFVAMRYTPRPDESIATSHVNGNESSFEDSDESNMSRNPPVEHGFDDQSVNGDSNSDSARYRTEQDHGRPNQHVRGHATLSTDLWMRYVAGASLWTDIVVSPYSHDTLGIHDASVAPHTDPEPVDEVFSTHSAQYCKNMDLDGRELDAIVETDEGGNVSIGRYTDGNVGEANHENPESRNPCMQPPVLFTEPVLACTKGSRRESEKLGSEHEGHLKRASVDMTEVEECGNVMVTRF